jgi:hypothetical protein
MKFFPVPACLRGLFGRKAEQPPYFELPLSGMLAAVGSPGNPAIPVEERDKRKMAAAGWTDMAQYVEQSPSLPADRPAMKKLGIHMRSVVSAIGQTTQDTGTIRVDRAAWSFIERNQAMLLQAHTDYASDLNQRTSSNLVRFPSPFMDILHQTTEEVAKRAQALDVFYDGVKALVRTAGHCEYTPPPKPPFYDEPQVRYFRYD